MNLGYMQSSQDLGQWYGRWMDWMGSHNTGLSRGGGEREREKERVGIMGVLILRRKEE